MEHYRSKMSCKYCLIFILMEGKTQSRSASSKTGMLSRCCLSALPQPCRARRKGKRRKREETRAGRHSSNMPRHSEGNHPKYFPLRSTLCVCVWANDSCFWGQSDTLTDKLSTPEQSTDHRVCVCVWESVSEKVNVTIIESACRWDWKTRKGQKVT